MNAKHWQPRLPPLVANVQASAWAKFAQSAN
jgi:hypothetical protein